MISDYILKSQHHSIRGENAIIAIMSYMNFFICYYYLLFEFASDYAVFVANDESDYCQPNDHYDAD